MRLHETKGKARAPPGQTIEFVRSRTQPAKAAVLRAFAELVGTEQYDEIAVGEITRRAGVSRSTFYEHFSGKSDLLTRSIAGPFKILADGVLSATHSNLVSLLEHFWSNRAFARGILLGSVRPRVATVLVLEIENRLKRHGIGASAMYRLPRRLIACQLADTMLGLITAWLAGEARCSPSELADGLSRSTHAVLAAMQN
jgi:AcrR family transcriptional regulator